METEQKHEPDKFREEFIEEEVEKINQFFKDKEEKPSTEDMRGEVLYIINHLKNERYFPPERRKKLLKENREEIENCKNKLKENDISDSDHIRAEKAIRVLERYNRIFNAIQEGKI